MILTYHKVDLARSNLILKFTILLMFFILEISSAPRETKQLSSVQIVSTRHDVSCDNKLWYKFNTL